MPASLMSVSSCKNDRLKDASPRDARYGLARYFPFFNFKRRHQAHNYQTPAQVIAVNDQAVLYSTLREEST